MVRGCWKAVYITDGATLDGLRCMEQRLGRNSKTESGTELLRLTGNSSFHRNIISPVAQSCPTLCSPVDCSTPGLPVHHQLPELAQTHVHLVSNAIQPSHPLFVPFSSYLQPFPASGSFPVSQFFTSGGQSIGFSTSASVLPKNIQN